MKQKFFICKNTNSATKGRKTLSCFHVALRVIPRRGIFKFLNFKDLSGQSLVEIIIALGIFSLIAAAIVTMVLGGFSVSEQGGEQAQANALAQEGMEAVRAIYDRSWDELVYNQSAVSISGGQWVFNGEGTNEAIGQYTRDIAFSNVCRDASNNIVNCPGASTDTNTKKVISTVSWTIRPGVTNSVRRVTYFTNPNTLSCDWSSVYVRDTFNSIVNTHDAVKVQAHGRYAYVVYTDAGGDTMDFAIVDAQATPTLLGSLNLLGSQKNIAISGNFAYIASDANTAEMQIVDITNPNAPVVRGVFNAAGTADGKGVFAIGTTVYLVRDGGSSPEFYIINASNPDAPTEIGNADLGTNTDSANEVYVAGNFAYVSSIANTQELKVVDITNPGAPVFNIGNPNYNYDIPSDSTDGIGLTGFDNYVILGNAAGKMYILDTHITPPYVTYKSMYQGNDQINDLAIGQGNNFMFAASNNNVNEEFEVVNISNTSNPIGTGSLQNSAPFFGVAFAKDSCVIYAVGGSNASTPELYVIVPGVDTIPPAGIINLAASSPTINSINLAWTAPGDDANVGTATTYDVRYSTSVINEGNWALATQVIGEPAPQIAGSAEAMTVSGLSEGTTYYFAIKTSDASSNVSVISNVPSLATTMPDTTAPSAINNLTLSGATQTSISLSWTAPGDDNNVGIATTYDVRYSTSAINEGNWASATQATGEPVPLIAGTNQTMTVSGLTAGTTYYFAIKTSDEVPNISAISNVPSLATLPLTQADRLVVDISARGLANVNRDIVGITVRNNVGSGNITIASMTVSWSGVISSTRLNTIRINNINRWTGTANSGTNINISDVAIPASTTYPITYLRFNRSMLGATLSISFIMIDGTTKTVTNITF